MRRAVFFDKDGVLNIDAGIADTVPVVYPGAADVIAYCRSHDFLVFLVTNQPIVARGILTEEALVLSLAQFETILHDSNPEAIIDKMYYCPHHPNANVLRYRVACECRKPKPGMIVNAAMEFSVDLKKSFMVGDRMSDIIAGSLAGCTTIHCRTGKHEEKPIETDLVLEHPVSPDHVINDVSGLVGILERSS